MTQRKARLIKRGTAASASSASEQPKRELTPAEIRAKWLAERQAKQASVASERKRIFGR